MKWAVAFVGFLFAGEAIGSDRFESKTLAIELEHKAPSAKGAFNALAVVTDNEGEQIDIPCTTSGTFLKKQDGTYTGYHRAFCQLAKKGKDKQYDSINLSITHNFSGGSLSSPEKTKYILDVERHNESSDDKLKKEWATLGGKDLSDVNLKAGLGRVVGDSPFKLLQLIEGGLSPHVGTLAYATEVERNVLTWGFNYYVGADYNVALDGRWGKSGSKYTIADDFSALKEAGNLTQFSFAPKAELTTRSAAVLPEALEDSREE